MHHAERVHVAESSDQLEERGMRRIAWGRRATGRVQSSPAECSRARLAPEGRFPGCGAGARPCGRVGRSPRAP
eukprot:2061404-Prymnesium_polylepis.1